MNEIRPIDANALLGLAHNHVDRTVDCNDIARFPTLDYAAVSHGEWIEKIEPYAYTAAGREIHIFHCSVCDFTWTNKRMVFDYFKHCPNCGAKMDGGEDDA